MSLQIKLPANFTSAHEAAVIDYLIDRLHGQNAWRLASDAFDILDRATIVTEANHYSFRAFYRTFVDDAIADEYLKELLSLLDIQTESSSLWARFARRIAIKFDTEGWYRTEVTETRLLLSYVLYWWGAFARGYAFEVEIFRDLQTSGIDYHAHNLLEQQGRFSPSDLVVYGLTGDIKTSVYFIQAAKPLAHDFYIVRLFIAGRSHTLVVMLQPGSWEKINGDTIDGELTQLSSHLSVPVRIRPQQHELVVLTYAEWKRRILRLQGALK